MSNRVNTRALKKAAGLTGILFASALLAGCSSLGALPGSGADGLVTGSIDQPGQGNINQSMPGVLQNGSGGNVPAGPYLPPANIGGSGTITPLTTASVTTTQLLPSSSNSSVTAQGQVMPVLLQSTSVGSQQTMPVQVASVTPPRVTQPFPDNAVPNVASSRNTTPQVAAIPSLTVVEPNNYRHTVESGESLYAIARRYGVTTDAIVRANGLSAPDQIYVGQNVAIPGRPDLIASRGANSVPAQTDSVTTASVTPAEQTQVSNTAAPTAQTEAPVAVASNTNTQTPNVSGADDFRWPVSGRVITDFQASRRTGINIEAPDGAAVRATENGKVIYVGSGIEGYGNLILVRHSNGFVSAYAHLKDITVSKGAAINRGDQIGSVGMSGSVNRPQLHFELRQGATPVDPMPLLAS